jgi:hypothetical protein
MKNLLELSGNIQRKLKGLSCVMDSHYFDKHDKASAKNPKKTQSFAQLTEDKTSRCNVQASENRQKL